MRTVKLAVAVALVIATIGTAHARMWYHINYLEGVCKYSGEITPQGTRDYILSLHHAESVSVFSRDKNGEIRVVAVTDKTTDTRALFFAERDTCEATRRILKEDGYIPNVDELR